MIAIECLGDRERLGRDRGHECCASYRVLAACDAKRVPPPGFQIDGIRVQVDEIDTRASGRRRPLHHDAVGFGYPHAGADARLAASTHDWIARAEPSVVD